MNNYDDKTGKLERFEIYKQPPRPHSLSVYVARPRFRTDWHQPNIQELVDRTEIRLFAIDLGPIRFARIREPRTKAKYANGLRES